MNFFLINGHGAPLCSKRDDTDFFLRDNRKLCSCNKPCFFATKLFGYLIYHKMVYISLHIMKSGETNNNSTDFSELDIADLRFRLAKRKT
jgi:hypothetical protein